MFFCIALFVFLAYIYVRIYFGPEVSWFTLKYKFLFYVLAIPLAPFSFLQQYFLLFFNFPKTQKKTVFRIRSNKEAFAASREIGFPVMLWLDRPGKLLFDVCSYNSSSYIEMVNHLLDLAIHENGIVTVEPVLSFKTGMEYFRPVSDAVPASGQVLK